MDRVITQSNFVIDKNLPEKREGLEPCILFTDGMVLQRGMVNKVFGKANYEGEVAVEIDGKIYYGCAKKGTFAVYLPPVESGLGLTMTIYGKANKVTIKNVCYGEVFLFSGQSNMEWKMSNTIEMPWPAGMIGKQYLTTNGITIAPYVPNEKDDPETYYQYVFTKELGQTYVDKAESQIEYDDLLRTANIDVGYNPQMITKNREPQDSYEIEKCWQIMNERQTVLQSSMFAYYFCKLVRKKFNVPVGAIQVAIGGTDSAAWTPKEITEKYKDFYTDIGYNPDTPNSVNVCYNTLIAPICGYVFKNFVWYQGEGESASEKYLTAFSQLVKWYKKAFDNPNFNTLVISMPRFCEETNYPEGYTQETYCKADKELGLENSRAARCRAVQQKLPKYIENCAVTVSVNDGDYDDIHPSDKVKIAYQAFCKYITEFCGVKEESAFFPTVKGVERVDDGVQISFDNLFGGLQFKNNGIGFQISSDGEKYKQVKGEKRGDTVFLSSAALGGDINYIKYGWLEFPRISRINTEYVSVFNSYGMPLDQFEIKV